ncbi:MAG: hypothetical protein RLZZ546_1646, partial [Bacteroidota bacterium]
CNVTEMVDNRTDNSWLSCTPSANPNPLRPSSHWIKYDLGEKHRMLNAHIWNYNVINKTSNGMENVAIDYSVDGVQWTNFGTYTWPLASGEPEYGGFMGPDFQSLTARYILITSMDNVDSCRGITKISFKAIYCPDEGSVCNDNNALTIDDKYDENCVCKGLPMAENLCDDNIVILGDSLLYPTNYSAIMHVQSISQIASNASTSFVGGKYIELNPGFMSEEGAIFLATIDTCNSTIANSSRIANRLAKRQTQNEKLMPTDWLTITNDDTNDEVLATFYVEKAGEVDLQILDALLKPIYTLAKYQYPNKGFYSKRFRTKKLQPGLYTIAYKIHGQSFYKKFQF